jgi:hypothetical protein
MKLASFEASVRCFEEAGVRHLVAGGLAEAVDHDEVAPPVGDSGRRGRHAE